LDRENKPPHSKDFATNNNYAALGKTLFLLLFSIFEAVAHAPFGARCDA